jgi:hypothetical protein
VGDWVGGNGVGKCDGVPVGVVGAEGTRTVGGFVVGIEDGASVGKLVVGSAVGSCEGFGVGSRVGAIEGWPVVG